MNTAQGYMIVNMAGASMRPGGLSLSPFAGSPKFVHNDRDQAEQEMIRLQALNPRAEFVLFKAVAEACPGLHDRGSLEIVELAP